MSKASYVADANVAREEPRVTSTPVRPRKGNEINEPEVISLDLVVPNVERTDSGWRGFVNYFLDGLAG
jgi:hypothetical protein